MIVLALIAGCSGTGATANRDEAEAQYSVTEPEWTRESDSAPVAEVALTIQPIPESDDGASADSPPDPIIKPIPDDGSEAALLPRHAQRAPRRY
jgi:hypothetical protein